MSVQEQFRIIIWSVITNIFLVFNMTPAETCRHPKMNILSPRLTRPGRVADPSVAVTQTQVLQLPPES